MGRNPLGIEQDETLPSQLFDQSGQRDLRCVSHPMEHRLAKERATNRNAVEPAGKLSLLPRFYRMRVAERMQIFVARDDLLVDPGFITARARPDDIGEGSIDFYLKRFLRSSGGMRQMEGF